MYEFLSISAKYGEIFEPDHPPPKAGSKPPRYTSLPKGRVAAHAQAEPGGADWDDDEPEAQQEPEEPEGAAPGGEPEEGLGWRMIVAF